MNELGYAEETDGMDEWYQDDGSWWSDQTWLQASQVWNETWSDWNEGWTADWTDGQWTEDWTWTGQESPQEYASSSQRPKTKQNQNNQKTPRSGIATSNGMTSCVSWWEWPLTRSKTKKHRKPGAARSEGVRSNKAQCRNQGSPSQDPRDYKEQPFRHDIHPDTSKQTPTTPGRNESGEKQENGETGRWDIV